MDFPYFDDPVNFAYLRDDGTPCHFCGSTDHRLDGNHFYGTETIESVCFACLRKGVLVDQDITTNDVDLAPLRDTITDKDRVARLTNEICYCTPPLPTWQDHSWLFVDGDFCKFVKIASKTDFTEGNDDDAAKRQFIDSLTDEYRELNDPEWLWSMLPDHPITSLKDGNYDLSVYLFSFNGRPVCTWDAN